MFRPKRGNMKGKHRQVKKEAFSFGKFTNFPFLVHGLAKISHDNTITKIQRSIIQTLYNLNGYKEAYPLSIADHAGTRNGEFAFETGIADGMFFDFLDEETAGKLFDFLESGKEYSILDFLVIVTYHYLKEERRTSLNFDHNILRFSFNEGIIEVLLFHSKGIRRMPLDDFLNKIINRIGLETKCLGLKPIKVEKIRAL